MARKTRSIQVINVNISIITANKNDYICITDMAKAKEGNARAADIIKNWIRNRTTLEFLGTWEQMNNPVFKVVEFDHLKMQAGLPICFRGRYAQYGLVRENREGMAGSKPEHIR